MIPRKTRSNKPPADPNQPPNGRRSDPGPPETTCSPSKGKNPRKRSPDSDEEACAAPPKKRANNQRPPSTTHSSPVAKRAASRWSTRKVARSAKKEVPGPADPDPDVIVTDDDGYPYVAYDNAPHLHPPPQRYKRSDTDQLSTSPEQVKGCSIKPCWRPAQQRRCRILQTDEAVEELGWKKVRKWMQAVRCRLCGETQVLRDLTKGCFNLEHWWRHLRVRHGIKREEEIEEKGEEKYKTLPIKDHVCVGACPTCGEGGAVVSPRQRNPTTRHLRRAVVESSDLSSLSSVNTTLSPPQESIPESMTSTSPVEPPSPGHALRAGPSNANNPPPHSALYTSANARPQYRYDTVATLTTFPISSSRDLPPLVPQSWAPYIDPSSCASPLSLLPAPRRPSVGNLSTSTPQPERTSSPSSASIIPSPGLPPVMIPPPGARSEREAADAPLFVHYGSPTATVASSPTGASTAPATRTRPEFLSRSTSALPQTPSPTVASASQPSSTFTHSTSGGGPPQSHPAPTTALAGAAAAVPSLSNYRWPPANSVPAGAPSPPCMTVASWEENDTEDEVDEVEAPPMLDLPRNVRTQDANETEGGGEDHAMGNEMEVSARLLHHFFVSVREMVDGPLASAPGLALAPRPRGETAGANDSEPLLQPEWAFIKQEESEPDMDEDEDMVDQLLGDS